MSREMARVALLVALVDSGFALMLLHGGHVALACVSGAVAVVLFFMAARLARWL